MVDKELGKRGEEIVCEYIRRKGLAVFKTNYRTRFGEIDVIAESETHIIFIEVKTREEGAMVSGADAVDLAKRRRIMLCAESFMNALPVKLPPRFDVAEITVKAENGKRKFSLKYIEDAF